jgi:hypothetical protein
MTTNIYYTNQSEENIPVCKNIKTVCKDNSQSFTLHITEKVDFDLATSLAKGRGIMLCHNTEMWQLLNNGDSKLGGSVDANKIIILIVFSSQGASIPPRVFIHEYSGVRYKIYGFGIHRNVNNNEYLPTQGVWKELLGWAAGLYEEVAQSNSDIAAIIANMPFEVRQLLAPPLCQVESLVAAYMLLRAKELEVSVDIDDKLMHDAANNYRAATCGEGLDWNNHKGALSQIKACLTKIYSRG